MPVGCNPLPYFIEYGGLPPSGFVAGVKPPHTAPDIAESGSQKENSYGAFTLALGSSGGTKKTIVFSSGPGGAGQMQPENNIVKTDNVSNSFISG
jgi:hypothetical protein